MTVERFDEIAELALRLFDEAQGDIEDKRDIYNGLRDLLIAVAPTMGEDVCECCLPPVSE